MVLRAMLQLLAICLLDNFFSHFNRRTSLMVRMDNLSAVIVTSRVFPGSSNGFHWIYPASSTPSSRGWRNGSESGGGLRRNTHKMGVYWDNQQNPYCPKCKLPLTGADRGNNILKCVNCKEEINLRIGDKFYSLDEAMIKI